METKFSYMGNDQASVKTADTKIQMSFPCWLYCMYIFTHCCWKKLVPDSMGKRQLTSQALVSPGFSSTQRFPLLILINTLRFYRINKLES